MRIHSSLRLLAPLALLVLGATGCMSSRPPSEQVDDAAVTSKVKSALVADATTNPLKVDVATNGAEAVALCSSDPPDAVLLDVMMPTMDGPTTFARLQEDTRTRSVPVILLTAKVQPSERRRYEDLAVAGVLAKPFDPIALPDQITDILGWRG